MQEVKINYQFNVGDIVQEKEGLLREGKIAKRWHKIRPVDETTYTVLITYTVVPEKTSYNSFRLNESDIRKVEIDERGIKF